MIYVSRWKFECIFPHQDAFHLAQICASSEIVLVYTSNLKASSWAFSRHAILACTTVILLESRAPMMSTRRPGRFMHAICTSNFPSSRFTSTCYKIDYQNTSIPILLVNADCGWNLWGRSVIIIKSNGAWSLRRVPELRWTSNFVNYSLAASRTNFNRSDWESDRAMYCRLLKLIKACLKWVLHQNFECETYHWMLVRNTDRSRSRWLCIRCLLEWPHNKVASTHVGRCCAQRNKFGVEFIHTFLKFHNVLVCVHQNRCLLFL